MTRIALEIRPFRTADQAAAKALILAGLEEHWGRLDPDKNPDLDDIAAAYAPGLFLVLYVGHRLVGTGALLPEGEACGRIVRMSVARTERRKGYGRLILDALTEQARRAGFNQLVLETTTTWQDAVAFYTRNGFQPTHEAAGDTHFVKKL